MAGKLERRLLKPTTSSKVLLYSENQPECRRVNSYHPQLHEHKCQCVIVIVHWSDDYFYLDSNATRLQHNNHVYIPHAIKSNGIKDISDDSALLIQRMSSVGVCPNQISQLLQLMEECDGQFKEKTVRNFKLKRPGNVLCQNVVISLPMMGNMNLRMTR